jgi:hypothetical protein
MRIDPKSLGLAIVAYEKMTLKERENVADRIYLSQPNLLASVLVLSRFGHSMEHIDEILKILMVLNLALEFAKVKIEQVTEFQQERELNLLIASVKLSEGLSEEPASKLTQNYVDNLKEKYALAFAYTVLNESGIVSLKDDNSKFLILAALNLVNCIANANDA